MSTPIPPERFRPPTRPPTQLEFESVRDWPSLQARGLDDVKASAAKWRDGLGALVTVVTGALVISGPDAIADIHSVWRYIITGSVFTGYGLTVISLFLALRAAAGNPAPVTLPDLLASQTSIREREVIRAIADARRIRHARRIMVFALGLLWVGTLMLWLVPQQSPSEEPFDNKIKVVLDDSTDLCGTLIDTRDDNLIVQTASRSTPLQIPLGTVRTVRAGDCS